MKWLKYFNFAFLFFLPVGYRVLLYQFSPGFHEYEAVFVYANDILLVIFVVAALIYFREYFKRIIYDRKFLILAVFFLLSALSIVFADYKILALYNFARLAASGLLALGVGFTLKSGLVKFKSALAVIAAAGVFEAVIAFFQFATQKSLGLWFGGEPYLPGFLISDKAGLAEIPFGLAKVDLYGAKLIRAYGTFPHPNILAGFLLLALFSLYYLWLVNEKRSVRLVLAVGIFSIALGLVLTFSRAAWLIAIILTSAWVARLLFTGYLWKTLRLFFVVCATGVFLISGLGFIIFPRAEIKISEPSVSYRLAYNEMSLDIIKHRPWGVGLGNQVIYSVKNEIYQKFGMNEVWQWQPIHNIYLLMAAEAGILGLAAFLIFIVFLFVNPKLQITNYQQALGSKFKIQNLFGIWNLEFGISAMMLLALLAFGLTDHFLWTLEPGRLMLWLVLGIMMGVGSGRF